MGSPFELSVNPEMLDVPTFFSLVFRPIFCVGVVFPLCVSFCFLFFVSLSLSQVHLGQCWRLPRRVQVSLNQYWCFPRFRIRPRFCLCFSFCSWLRISFNKNRRK